MVVTFTGLFSEVMFENRTKIRNNKKKTCPGCFYCIYWYSVSADSLKRYLLLFLIFFQTVHLGNREQLGLKSNNTSFREKVTYMYKTNMKEVKHVFIYLDYK